ncbi:hypothetical protein GCM10010533_03940 [Mycolicibacterium pallens]
MLDPRIADDCASERSQTKPENGYWHSRDQDRPAVKDFGGLTEDFPDHLSTGQYKIMGLKAPRVRALSRMSEHK